MPECQTGRIGNWYQKRPDHGHSSEHRFFGFVTWYHTPDLQSHFLDGIFAARNWMVCTLERRATILSVLEVASNRPLLRSTVVDAHPSKALPGNFSSDLDAGRYAHLYHADAALYAHIAGSGGCIHRLGNVWQRELRKVVVDDDVE